jgi:hypothetical protein
LVPALRGVRRQGEGLELGEAGATQELGAPDELGHHRFPRTTLPDVDENDPRTYGDLLAADIVLLEENEANIQSSHVRLLRSKLLGTAE